MDPEIAKAKLLAHLVPSNVFLGIGSKYLYGNVMIHLQDE